MSLALAMPSTPSVGSMMLIERLRVQPAAHPVGLLRPVLVNDVVADVVAVLKHPEFRYFTRLCRHPRCVRRGNKSIPASHDDQQRTVYLLHHALEIKCLQFRARFRLACSFEPVG